MAQVGAGAPARAGARRRRLPADRAPRHHRRPAHRGARRQRGHHRLVLPRALRRSQPVRRAPRQPTGRPLLDPRRSPRTFTTKQLYLPGTAVLVTRFFSETGVGEVVDFMPLVPGCTIVRRIEVVRGSLSLPHPLRARLRLRAQAAPPRARRRSCDVPRRATSRASCARSATSSTAEGAAAVAEVTLARGERASFVLAVGAWAAPGTTPRSSRRSRRPYFLARLDRPEPLSRALARGRRPLGDHAQAADLPADRGGRRSTDDEPAGADRRPAQLGLPLLLAARLGLHDVRVPAPRLPRGGRRLPRPGCTSAERGRKRRAAPGHVRASTAAAT